MIKGYFLDPGFALAARWVLAVVFILALSHKLKAPLVFQATLQNYRLVPEPLLMPASYVIMILEIAAVAGLVANSPVGSGLAAALLTAYTTAISINLIRGRLDIDCGCSGPAIRQTLSITLVYRNVGLISLAILTLATSNPRPLTPLDWFTAIAAVVTFILLYFAATYLSASSTRFNRSH